MYEDKMVAAYEELKPYYDDLIKKMVVKETWIPRIDSVARRIIANKERYKTISDECGGSIPWQFIGIIHYRESNCNFDTICIMVTPYAQRPTMYRLDVRCMRLGTECL